MLCVSLAIFTITCYCTVCHYLCIWQVVYSTASEDATNESLPWEPMNDLDFEDLLLNTPTNSKNKRHCAGKRISNYRKKVNWY